MSRRKVNFGLNLTRRGLLRSTIFAFSAAVIGLAASTVTRLVNNKKKSKSGLFVKWKRDGDVYTNISKDIIASIQIDRAKQNKSPVGIISINEGNDSLLIESLTSLIASNAIDKMPMIDINPQNWNSTRFASIARPLRTNFSGLGEARFVAEIEIDKEYLLYVNAADGKLKAGSGPLAMITRLVGGYRADRLDRNDLIVDVVATINPVFTIVESGGLDYLIGSRFAATAEAALFREASLNPEDVSYLRKLPSSFGPILNRET